MASDVRIKRRADVAQLVEQSIRNRQVIGSSPIVGSSVLLSPPLGLCKPTHIRLAFISMIPCHLIPCRRVTRTNEKATPAQGGLFFQGE